MTLKAPTAQQLGTALGDGMKGAAAGMALGPVGAAVGGLAALISDLVPGLVLNPSTKPAVSDAAAFITNAPTEASQVEALKQDPVAADQFKAQVVQIATDEQAKRDARDERIQQMLLEQGKTDAADTANARQQTVHLAQAGSSIAYGAPIVSVIVLVAFAALAITVLLHAVPEGNRDIANIMLGYVGGMATAVVSYWVGSSSGSAAKTGVIAGLLSKTTVASASTAGVPQSNS